MCASMFDSLLASPLAGEEPPASPLPPMKSIPGGEVPGYAAFCPDYFQGCFSCPDFMPDKVRFCRKWNRTFNGADVVELEAVDGADASPLTEPALPEQDTGRNWWTYGRKKSTA